MNVMKTEELLSLIFFEKRGCGGTGENDDHESNVQCPQKKSS